MAQRVAVRQAAEAEFLRLLREDSSPAVRLQAVHVLAQAGRNTPVAVQWALIAALRRERDDSVKLALMTAIDYTTPTTQRPPTPDAFSLLKKPTQRRHPLDTPLAELARPVGRVTPRQFGRAILWLAAVIEVLNFFTGQGYALLHLLFPLLVR